MSDLLKLVCFLALTAIIVWFSRKPLRDVRSHGFYRFFAWEAIAALLVSNVEYWFDEPFSLRQLASWVLLCASGYCVIHGAVMLGRAGKPSQDREDPTLIGIEKTTVLVTTGIYRYIRHPVYSSLLFLAWGASFKHITELTLALAVVASVFLYLTARREESENIAYFGDLYREYMKRSRMFVPFLF